MASPEPPPYAPGPPPPPQYPVPGQPPPQYPPPLYQAPPQYYVQPARTNQMAVASLIAGIVSWLCFPILGALLAILFGHMARSQIRQTGEAGSGMATVGIWLGYIHFAVLVLAIVAVILIV
ncbi:MAG: DUF4190 domain-containing protein, partial [Candidatus Dormiibacterota bacterium]